MEHHPDTFEYTYSASQQSEIARIRQKYLPAAESKLEQLRRLDRSATKKATTVSICVGVIGSLIMGVGMCCTMVWGDRLFVPGVLIGLVGIAGVAAAYPLFSRIVRKERERIAPQILKLADELSDSAE